ncbi:MAG: hypothetical protein IKN49_04945 [Elusimicrobiaceae bacterium]|nr:hypothetical protein [Elusimicrobiaceae bacterium]
MKKLITLLIITTFLTISHAQPVPLAGKGFIKNIAGMPGKRAFSGDKEDALRARLANPSGIAVDRFHNIYIADTNNHRIRRVDARSGYIETIAGNGRIDFFSDGGNADMTSLRGPSGLAIDEEHGFLFVADAGHHRVRMITLKNYPDMVLQDNDPMKRWAFAQIATPDDMSDEEVASFHIPRGYIYTVAGNGRAGYEGEGAQAIASSLNGPSAVAISPAGELYISDTDNHRIRKIDRNTGKLITVVGNGEPGDSGDSGLAVNARLYYPTDIAFDKQGNLFISDTGNNKIRVVEHRSQRIFTIAGDGKRGYMGDNTGRSVDARFNHPTGLAMDSKGRIYVSDTDNQRIRRISIDFERRQTRIETVVGNGRRGYNGEDINAWDAKLAYPSGITITPRDMLYITDSGNNLIRRVEGISTIHVPTTYTDYSAAATEPQDNRSYYDVLYKPQVEAAEKKGS